MYAEYYLMPDNISANGRNYVTQIMLRKIDETFGAREGVKGRRIEMMKAPDDISANGRNYVTRIILRETDETVEPGYYLGK